MSKFWTKLRVCIAEPRKLGFFMGEKKWKSLVQLFLILILALTPYLIRLNINDVINISSEKYLKTVLMTEQIDYDIKIIDGKLVGNGCLSIATDECVVFINPLQQMLENDDNNYVPVYEFREDGVLIRLSSGIIDEITYYELGCMNLDFNEIFDSNYIEFNAFISVINDVYRSTKIYTNIIYFLSVLISSYISLIFSAVIIALFGGMANKVVSYKFRFKGALDAQFISIVFIFLASLFDIIYLELVGIFFSIIYFIRGLMSIVRIEIRKVKKEGQ
jgi:hypothetical protein